MLNNVNVRGSYEEFSKNLVCLSWRGFQLKSIPQNLYLGNLAALDMRNSSLQHVWDGTRFLLRLKILNLSHSHGLRTTPDFSGLPNLERLILKDCINLVEIDDSIGDLEKLVVLNLDGCKNLMKLPMKKLNLLSAKSWDSIWSWVSPRKNIESSSFALASLPHSLTSLNLGRCNLSEIPSALTMLSSLEHLDLSGNPFTSLPESMNNLVKLCALHVSGCRKLTMLPELPHSLKRLYGMRCTSLKRITNLPDLDRSDPWPWNIMLESNLWYCGKLVDVESLFDTLPLRSFDIKLLKDIDLFDLKPKGDVEVQGNNHYASFGSTTYFWGSFGCGIFSIFVHGSKIPDRFSYRSMGSTVFCIIVPSHLNIKILGLNVCILYARQSDQSLEVARGRHRHSLELRNETKGLKWKLSLFNEVEWKEMNEDMLWLSHWIMGNDELECGEKVCFEVEEQDGFLTKEIGVQFVYEQQNKEKEDVPSNSEDTTIQHERSPWKWRAHFSESTRSGYVVHKGIEAGVHCIHDRDKKVISTIVCATQYFLCNSEVINLENESHIEEKITYSATL